MLLLILGHSILFCFILTSFSFKVFSCRFNFFSVYSILFHSISILLFRLSTFLVISNYCRIFRFESLYCYVFVSSYFLLLILFSQTNTYFCFIIPSILYFFHIFISEILFLVCVFCFLKFAPLFFVLSFTRFIYFYFISSYFISLESFCLFKYPQVTLVSPLLTSFPHVSKSL